LPDENATAKLSLDIDGLKRGLKEAREEIKHANAVFKSETAGMDDWTKDADGLSAKLRNLGEVLSKQRYILDNYNDQVQKHRENQEKAADEAQRLRAEMQALADKGVEPTAAEYKKLDKQYQAAIKSEKAEADQIRKLETSIINQNAEINKTEAAYKKWENAQADLERESKSLVKVVSDQEKELKDLKQQYVDVASSCGENSDAAKELAGRIEGLSTELRQNRKTIKDAQDSAEKLDHSYDELGDSAKDAGKEAEEAGGLFSKAKEYIVAGLAVEAITRAWDALKNAVSSVASGLSDLVVGGAAFADDILTLSSTTGLATETLQEFRYMEDLTDVSSGAVAKSLTKLKKQMASAQGGSKTATAAFEKLGVSYVDLDGNLRNSEDVFYDVIDAMGAMENETERDALAMDIFGKSGTELNPIIEAGSEALNDFRKEAHEVGYILDDSTLKSLGRTQDAMDRLDKRTEGLKNQFSVGLAPAAEKLVSTLDETLGNVRTQRAITVLSEATGSLLDKLAEGAAVVLPALTAAFGTFDTRLATYTDEQLERKAVADAMIQSWNDSKTAFEENAGAINENRDRVQSLFEKLKDLAGETGHVKETDEELARYIIDELNESLGTNIEMVDGVIQGWQDVQKEIQATIDMQTAQALLDAGRDKYVKSLQSQESAAKTAAKTQKDLKAKTNELKEAEEKLEELRQEAAKQQEERGEVTDRLNSQISEQANLIDGPNGLRAAVQALSEDFSEQDAVAKEMYATTEQYSKAMTAFAEGNYKATENYVIKGYDLQRDFAKNSGLMTATQIDEMKKAKDEQKRLIDWYNEKLKAGEDGFNADELKRYKDHYDELTHALDDAMKANQKTTKDGGKDAAKALGTGFSSVIGSVGESMRQEAVSVGKSVGQGMDTGIESMRETVKSTAKSVMKTALNAMKTVAQIASPSKVTEEYGEYIDEGWIVGMKAKLGALKATASQVAEAAMQPADPVAVGGGRTAGRGGTTNNFTQNIYAPKTPSRLELYRDSKNLLEMAGGLM